MMSTTDTAISTTAYTQIAGPGAVAATVTVTRPAQFAFSATAPAANFAGHHLDTDTSIPLATMGSGIYMWVKAEYANAFAVITLGTDATISNGASGGGGGGGGGDASSANQTAVQAVAGSDASKAISIQGITSGKAISISAASLPLPSGASTNVGITGSGSKTLTDINTTLGTPLQAGGSITVSSAPITAVTNSGLSNIDVALSTRLKPADTLFAVTTVGTITNPVAVTGTFWQATQPVSGTITANAGTNLNTSALALDATLTGKAQTTRLTDGTTDITMITTSSDGTAAASNRIPVQSHNKAYNGTTWDLLRAIGSGVKSTFTGILNVLPQVIYNSTPQTLTNGQGTDLQGDANGYLKVNIAAGSGVTATLLEAGFKVSQSYTRPANTTAYVIGYAISASTSAGAQLTYSAVGAANQYGVIERVEVRSSVKGATLPQIMVWFSGSTMSGATANDGTALEIDATTFALGGPTIPCVETSNTAARSQTVATNLNHPFKLDASGNFYVVLSALNAYTPASGEVLTVLIYGRLR